MHLDQIELEGNDEGSEHYRKYDVTLYNDQSNELLQLVSAVYDIGKNELQKALKEADKRERGDIFRNMWKLNVEKKAIKKACGSLMWKEAVKSKRLNK